MYSSHKQIGRVRVNKVNESKKNKRTRSQMKVLKKNRYDHLYKLQDDLFREGLDYSEYCNYIQEKINKDKFQYKGLSTNDLDNLKKRYRTKILMENNRYNEIGDKKELSRKRRAQFRKKKKELIDKKRGELIQKLFSVMKNQKNTSGVLRDTSNISTDVEHWNLIKKGLFTGGKYLDTHDMDWVKVYRVLVSNTTPHLFNLHSEYALNDYVINH